MESDTESAHKARHQKPHLAAKDHVSGDHLELRTENEFHCDPHLLLQKLQKDARVENEIAKRAHLEIPRNLVKDALKRGDKACKDFNKLHKQGANEEIQSLKFAEASLAFNEARAQMLNSKEETRACWLDRKTIVSAGPGQLSREIKELAAAGINKIYFECDNGGYSTYTSSLMPLNPDISTKWQSWDPLREAIDAAHHNGIKIEAWTKDFLGCNKALIEKLKQDHPTLAIPAEGPILAQHSSAAKDPCGDWALRQSDGKVQSNTNDLFLDPANPEVRKFVQGIMLEIADRYPDIDGLQYDYIRYPFHNEQLGLNDNNWKSFQNENSQYKETARPTDPSKMDSPLLANWNQWKAHEIDTFVADTSERLHKTNPKLDISAAVYPLDLNESVRQHWPLWMRNSWINTLNPMTYVPHDPSSKDAILSAAEANKFKQDILSIKAAAGSNGDILPGIEIARVNSEGMLKELQISQQAGFNGETLFATSVMDATRLKELDIITAQNDLTNYARLTGAWSELGSNENRKERQSIAEQAEAISTSVSALPFTAGKSELEATIAQINAAKKSFATRLEQFPSEQSIWTQQMLNDLRSGADSLNSAANPPHFAAWNSK